MLNSSLFNQSHLFKIKIKDNSVLNFSFFIMNYFVYAGMERERDRGRVCTKMQVCIFKGREVKKFDFLHTFLTEKE